MSQNFVLIQSEGCFFVLFCVQQNIVGLFRSETTVLDHTETLLTIIIFTAFFSGVRIIVFDNDFWYMINYFLDLIVFLNGDSIFVLVVRVIMSVWLPIFAVITLAGIGADNAMLETLAIFLLTL